MKTITTLPTQYVDHFTWAARIRRTQDHWHGYPWKTDTLYRSLVEFVADQIWPASRPPYYFQAEPNLRIQEPGAMAVPWHTDSDFGHLVDEWNCWMPLTEITDASQTVWIEDPEGIRKPVMLEVGEALLFRGAVLRHGNYLNSTMVTRRSMDFRLIRQDLFRDLDIKTVEYGMRLKVGDYWRE